MKGKLIKIKNNWFIEFKESQGREHGGWEIIIDRKLPLYPDDVSTYDFCYQSYTPEEFNRGENIYDFEIVKKEEEFLATPESVEWGVRTVEYAKMLMFEYDNENAWDRIYEIFRTTQNLNGFEISYNDWLKENYESPTKIYKDF